MALSHTYFTVEFSMRLPLAAPVVPGAVASPSFEKHLSPANSQVTPEITLLSAWESALEPPSVPLKMIPSPHLRSLRLRIWLLSPRMTVNLGYCSSDWVPFGQLSGMPSASGSHAEPLQTFRPTQLCDAVGSRTMFRFSPSMTLLWQVAGISRSV